MTDEEIVLTTKGGIEVADTHEEDQDITKEKDAEDHEERRGKGERLSRVRRQP